MSKLQEILDNINVVVSQWVTVPAITEAIKKGIKEAVMDVLDGMELTDIGQYIKLQEILEDYEIKEKK